MTLPRGKSTENLIKQLLDRITENLPCHPVIRLFDTYSARGNTLPDRPADFILVCKDKAIFFEVKETKFNKGLKYASVRPAQEKAMLVCISYKIPYYLIIREYSSKRYFIIPAEVYMQHLFERDKKIFMNEKVLKSYIPYSSLSDYQVSNKEISRYLEKLIKKELKGD